MRVQGLILVVIIAVIAVIAYYLLATMAGDPLGVQRRAATAIDEGRQVEITADPNTDFWMWFGQASQDTSLRW